MAIADTARQKLAERANKKKLSPAYDTNYSHNKERLDELAHDAGVVGHWGGTLGGIVAGSIATKPIQATIGSKPFGAMVNAGMHRFDPAAGRAASKIRGGKLTKLLSTVAPYVVTPAFAAMGGDLGQSITQAGIRAADATRTTTTAFGRTLLPKSMEDPFYASLLGGTVAATGAGTAGALIGKRINKRFGWKPKSFFPKSIKGMAGLSAVLGLGTTLASQGIYHGAKNTQSYLND